MAEAVEGGDRGRRATVRGARRTGGALADPRRELSNARVDVQSGHDEGAAHGFPGCRPIRIAREEIADYEGRIEYWDADTEIAWTAREPTSVYHELPGQRLARLTERIAEVRGAQIESYGSGDLLVRDAQGERHRIMQADQILYLHPGSARPLGHAVEVGHDDLPDVVLEVDLTTDVRPRKMGLYREWGFPELWVEVPENRAPSRPNKRPGLTVRILGPSGYEEVPESRAFPTWTATEIHAAINERALSAPTVGVLRRVGRLLGERGGTVTDDDLFMRVEREQSRREGVEEGIETGIETGIERGVAKGRFEMLTETLATRDIAISKKLAASATLVAATPVRDLIGAALVCRDEADFLRRIGSAPAETP
ncbi:MAG: hypothetical protein OXI79_21215 [Gammaproteobacteria bacterium]|nr:hypothetical protein [Gammaproteobacteria bacterium]